MVREYGRGLSVGYGWRRNAGSGDIIRAQNSGYGIGEAEGANTPP